MAIHDTDEIRNLLYRYAELIDDGDFDAVGELFAAAEVDWGGDISHGAGPVAERLRATTRRYADGTPHTVHVIANPIIEVDGERAAARSRFIVVQPVGDGVLAPIIFGRYVDTFVRVDRQWRFASRRYVVEHLGDLSQHLPESLVALLRSPAGWHLALTGRGICSRSWCSPLMTTGRWSSTR